MNNAFAQHRYDALYELRFADMFHIGRGYAFPCDAQGHVVIDELGERARLNYFYARAMVGRELFAPVTCKVRR